MRCQSDPCPSCPYRRDTPPGVWDRSEYERLPAWDEGQPLNLRAFLCHYSPELGETVCRGWLTVHRESVAARLLCLRGEVTAEELYAEPTVALFASGQEACDAGLAGVERPGRDARRVIARLSRREGKRRGGEER